mgnify:CR=1 FL=1
MDHSVLYQTASSSSASSPSLMTRQRPAAPVPQQQAPMVNKEVTEAPASQTADVDYLDIPAFLRKKEEV